MEHITDGNTGDRPQNELENENENENENEHENENENDNEIENENDDFEEDMIIADDDDPEDVYEEEEEPRRTGRRGRPPGSKNKTTIARERMEARKDGDDSELMGDVTAERIPPPAKRGRPAGRGNQNRGRGRGGPSHVTAIPLDQDGNPQRVENDELVLPIDEEGEKKVDALGNLIGGTRDYRVRTFKLDNRGDRLYMLSTEPARCMGFRDSYLLFQKHKKLYKIIVTEEEKFEMINRDIIPHSYKGRAIGIVTARSVFREFGAKIIIGGKRVIDDYYETEAKAAGFIPGQIADPDDRLPPPGTPYNKNQYVAWHGASAVYHQYQAAPPPARETMLKDSSMLKRKKVVITDDNWMFENASTTNQYNTVLKNMRARAWNTNGYYEPNTGLNFYPLLSQPTKATFKYKEDGSKKFTIQTELIVPSPFVRTGLKDVDPSVFEGTVSPEILSAIKAQRESEQKWETTSI